MSSSSFPIFSALFVGILWGAYPILNKLAYSIKEIPMRTLVTVLSIFIGLSALIYALYNRTVIAKEIKEIKSNKQWAYIIIAGVIWFVGAFYYNDIVINYSPYKALVFATVSASLVSILLSKYLFKINISNLQAVSIGIIIFGLYILAQS